MICFDDDDALCHPDDDHDEDYDDDGFSFSESESKIGHGEYYYSVTQLPVVSR